MTDVLLDATDTTRRLLQHGAVVAGVAVLAIASPIANIPGRLPVAILLIGTGLALFVAASRIKQRWEVVYKEHRIRFENNPFAGERLFIDDAFVGKGKLGFRSEIRAIITTGAGVGDRIVVVSEAGLTRFRCRIVVEAASTPESEVSDAELLAEVRRRGLRVEED